MKDKLESGKEYHLFQPPHEFVHSLVVALGLGQEFTQSLHREGNTTEGEIELRAISDVIFTSIPVRFQLLKNPLLHLGKIECVNIRHSRNLRHSMLAKQIAFTFTAKNQPDLLAWRG